MGVSAEKLQRAYPNIVTIYDIGDADGIPFIAMELIQGRTLRSAVSAQLAFEQLAEIGAQVTEALSVAHQAGIVHRDIKPENIMIRDDGYVKIVDFGLVRVLPISTVNTDSQTQVATTPGTLLGTIRYVSPEQARGESVTAATDIFSLGLVLYELSTGNHPFHADSQLATLHGILSQPPIPPFATENRDSCGTRSHCSQDARERSAASPFRSGRPWRALPAR